MNSKEYNEFVKQTSDSIAFILGRYITSDLGVVRSLGRKNIPTILLNPSVKPIASFSKYYKGMLCPHPKHNEEKYVNFLLNLGKNLNQKGVLLPDGDAEVIAILKNKKTLEKYYHFSSADLKITEKLLNKHIFYETLENLDIPHPKTFFVNGEPDVKKVCKKISYPCIIKPVFSDYFVSDFKVKLFKVDCEKELFKKYKTAYERNHEVMIQEIIPGGAENAHGFNTYYDKNFNVNGSFMYRRIREWPHNFGNGCFIESVSIPELEEITSALIKKIGYYGIVDVEFKKDSRDNKFKLIEINPRSWMQNSLPLRCGMDFSYIAYMDAIGKNIPKSPPKYDHVKWLFFFEDIQSSYKSMLNKKLTFINWIKSFEGEKECGVFTRDDPFPFFVMCVKTLYQIKPSFIKNFFIKS